MEKRMQDQENGFGRNNTSRQADDETQPHYARYFHAKCSQKDGKRGYNEAAVNDWIRDHIQGNWRYEIAKHKVWQERSQQRQ